MRCRGKSRIWQLAGVASIAAINNRGRRAHVFAGLSIVARDSDGGGLVCILRIAVMTSSWRAQTITWAGGVSSEAAMLLWVDAVEKVSL